MTTILLSALLGCAPDAALRAEYDRQQAAALAAPPLLRAEFVPDAVLTLSAPLVQRIVQGALVDAAPITGDIAVGGGVVLTPKLRAVSATLKPSRACETCIAAVIALKGPLKFQGGILGRGQVPVRATARVDVAVAAVDRPQQWSITAQVRRVRDVELELSGVPDLVGQLAAEPVRAWAEQTLTAQAPARLASIRRDAVPVRALTVRPRGAAVQIALKTEATEPGRIAQANAKLDTDWRLEVSTQSLVSLGRTAAFRSGPQTALQVVGTPESLSVRRGGFTLGVRVWRLGGGGWWRDLDVEGTLGIADGYAQLTPTDAAQRDASPGASGPLAALTETFLPSAVAALLAQSAPASGSTTVGGTAVDVDVTRMLGAPAGDALQLSGTLTLPR